MSLGVFVFLAYLVLYHWYPDFFYRIDGGWEGMRIIIGVDLVLGPLLTLIVFRSGKPGLKTDLSLIGTFQVICLLAGVYIVYSERPLYFIYYEKHFYSVRDETFADYSLLPPDVAQFDAGIPAQLYVKLPDNPIEEASLREILYAENVPLWLHTPLFEPLAPHMSEVIVEGIDYAALLERDSNDAIPEWLRTHGGELQDYAFYPIHSRYLDAFLAINKASHAIVDIIEIPPPMSTSSDS
jgi:hypothetical protein